ncbi:MAG: hypothetical protein NWE78_02085 [Candidatus Bathyarchaeota archaeon]|nr:hypothetical protein [Candidatus Bathyarchaeota archaeon]
MLGRFENFSENVHGIAFLTFTAQLQQIQLAIIHAFHLLNQRKYRLDEITGSSVQANENCEVHFEVGIGENAAFTFLDEEELAVLEVKIVEKRLAFLDFLCVFKYYVSKETKGKSPLKFDYYMLRFRFDIDSMELSVFHERGPRHVHAEEVIGFIIDYIRIEASKEWNFSLKTERIQT